VPAPTASNRAPQATGTIPVLELVAGGEAAVVDAASYFRDPDGDPLTYSALSGNPDTVRAGVSGSEVTLTPLMAGDANFTVTATDPAGLTASQAADVKVTAGPVAPESVPPAEEVCGDWGYLSVGDYLYLNNVHNKGAATDYEQCVLRRVVDGEDQYGWRWRWPGTGREARAFPEVIYGQTPWRAATTPSLPRRISAVEALRVDYDVELRAEGDFNLVFVMWITSSDPPIPETITHYINIEVYRSEAVRSAMQSAETDQVEIDGVRFELRVHAAEASDDGRTRIRFASLTQELNTGLDFRKFLDYLVEQGHLPADHYVTALEAGNEVRNGSGELWFRHYEVEVDTAPPVQPPTVPTGLRVSRRGQDFIEWSWDAVAGADGYHVQFQTDESLSDNEEASTSVPMYRQEELDPATTGFLRVRSVAGAGAGQRVSGWTGQVPGTTLPPPLPPPDWTPPPLDPTPVAAAEERCGDWDTFDFPSHVYKNNVWNKGNVRGYEQCVMRRVVDGKDEYGWRWRWPRNRRTHEVRGYPEVIHGRSPWDTRPTASRLPLPVSQVRQIRVDFDAYMAAEGDYNLAFSMWLTSASAARRPASDDGCAICELPDLHEIMIWVDRTDWAPSGPEHHVAEVEIGGSEYGLFIRQNVRNPDAHPSLVGQTYIGFAKYTDQFEGTIHLDEFLDYLLEHGHIPDDLYVYNVELGNEVKDGSSGELWLKTFRVDVR